VKEVKAVADSERSAIYRPCARPWPWAAVMVALAILAAPAMVAGQGGPPVGPRGGDVRQALESVISEIRSPAGPLTIDEYRHEEGRLRIVLKGEGPGRTLTLFLTKGRGRSFCSGGDIEVTYSGSGEAAMLTSLGALCQALDASPALQEGVASLLARPPERGGGPSSERSPWPGTMALMLGLMALGAGLVRRMPVGHGRQATSQLLVGAGVALTAGWLMDFGWGSWLAPVPWLVLFAAACVLLAMQVRRMGAAGIALAVLAVVAVGIRLAWEWLPANWYYDFWAPADLASGAGNGQGAPLLRRDGGSAGTFALLGMVLPVTSSWFFVASGVASGIGAVLAGAALWRPGSAERRGVFERWGWLIWGGLLAVDPMQVVLGASGTVHTWGLLSFGAGLYCYGRWHEATVGEAKDAAMGGAAWLLVAMLLGAVTGWTRPELAWFPLAWPLLIQATRPGPVPWREMLRTLPFMVLVAAAGSLPWLGRERGVEIQGLEAGAVGKWLASLIPPFLPFDYGHLGIEHVHPQGSIKAFTLFLCAATVSIYRQRRFGFVFIPALFVIMTFPRLFTPFYKAFFVSHITNLRYDIILGLFWPLAVAIGVGAVVDAGVWLWRRSPDWRVRWVTVAAAVLLIWMAVDEHRLFNGKLAAQRPVAFQAEFRFLRQNLGLVPKGETLVVPWHHGWEGERAGDLDHMLSHPNVMLLFDRPDLDWQVIHAHDSALPRSDDWYWYAGSVCGLDVGRASGEVPGEARERFRRLVELCREMEEEPQLVWLSRERVSVTPLSRMIPERGSSLGLGLARVVAE